MHFFRSVYNRGDGRVERRGWMTHQRFRHTTVLVQPSQLSNELKKEMLLAEFKNPKSNGSKQEGKKGRVQKQKMKTWT